MAVKWAPAAADGQQLCYYFLARLAARFASCACSLSVGGGLGSVGLWQCRRWSRSKALAALTGTRWSRGCRCCQWLQCREAFHRACPFDRAWTRRGDEAHKARGALETPFDVVMVVARVRMAEIHANYTGCRGSGGVNVNTVKLLGFGFGSDKISRYQAPSGDPAAAHTASLRAPVHLRVLVAESIQTLAPIQLRLGQRGVNGVRIDNNYTCPSELHVCTRIWKWSEFKFEHGHDATAGAQWPQDSNDSMQYATAGHNILTQLLCYYQRQP